MIDDEDVENCIKSDPVEDGYSPTVPATPQQGAEALISAYGDDADQEVRRRIKSAISKDDVSGRNFWIMAARELEKLTAII